MVAALVVTYYFENRFLSFSTSYILTTIVIIYLFDVMDSLGSYIYIFIDYNPL